MLAAAPTPAAQSAGQEAVGLRLPSESIPAEHEVSEQFADGFNTCLSIVKTLNAAPVSGNEVRYFRQPSSCGRWHECTRIDDGAVAFVRAAITSHARMT
ncbi:hypothetical protein A9762_06020 [Pandoraea sp. ISTKB]|nr:hypothetical protein A9762_06020 [Pandoraea sp. ISTKB]